MSAARKLTIPTPEWAEPLLVPARYKGAKGGRASGKSHFFAENLVEEHVRYPGLQSVCVREIQRSLKFSAKRLIESKIQALGLGGYFECLQTEIRDRRGGLIIFEGLQDHNADTIKSLEGFDRCWVEEAHALSARSMEILIPTIRKDGSEIWMSWNPDEPDDPVETLFNDNPDAIVVHVNYTDNPWLPEEMRKLAAWQKRTDYEKYLHIWEGQHNLRSDAQVLGGKWRVDEFEPGADWSGPYFGLDFGFAQDPLAAGKSWIHNDTLYVEYEAGGIGIELDQTARYLIDRIPGIDRHTIEADNARPESISYLKRNGLPRIKPVKKWTGSVDDGITHLRSYREIVIHPRCRETISEARLYSYKIDKKSGNIMPDVVDQHNHYIDQLRYALTPMIRRRDAIFTGIGSAN